MTYRVMVLIVSEYPDQDTRWVEAEIIDGGERPNHWLGAAHRAARAYFEYGYSPTPGQHFRVFATHVEKSS